MFGTGFSFSAATLFIPATVTAANNGVSLSGTDVVLGNNTGAVLAQLLSNREIPLNNFLLTFLDATGTDRLIIQPAAGGFPFSLRFRDDTFPADFSIGLDALNNRLFLRNNGNTFEQFFYQPFATPNFLFSDNGTQGAAGAVLGITMQTSGVGLGIENTNIPGAVNAIECISGNGGAAGCFAQFSSDAGVGLSVGEAGTGYPIALLNGQALLITNQIVGAFIQFCANGNNSGGFRWFHRIANVVTQTMEFLNPGRLGIRVAGPTAAIHLPAGVNAVSGAPFKYNAGVTAQTVLENGAKNFDGTNEFITAGGVNYTIKKCLRATANLNFPNTAAQTSSDLTIAVTGAAVNDPVTWSTPAAAQAANICITAFVSAANTVTVRLNNYSAIAVDIGADDYTVTVEKFV